MECNYYLSMGLFQAIITAIVWFCASYIKEKGKNLATREDIQKITDKIESVKIAYAKELEDLKSHLNAKFHAQTVRFEKEFAAFTEIWRTLLRLKNAAVHLRPPGDFYPAEERTPDEEKRMRFEEYCDAFKDFYLALYANKPFFPVEIFSCIEDLLSAVFSHASEFKKVLDFGIQPEYLGRYWDEAERNIDLIVTKTDTVCEMIRQRIQNI
jgi:hypothetical protein